ncbi:hypothetical protein GTG28_20575 [Vibrio sp. OCN044]|uniref:Uncharacterized protein n=1 Tax=Vibrio tetraodonis subsp. pristinus TaxID=2695891 RepID=A0A6L8M5J4_9VIBR|nr:hypothetical protein [Vibrio tetraodonis]MYM61599.1 hypothetical protein [Vibrio tetraodonis subsp. pristinus]
MSDWDKLSKVGSNAPLKEEKIKVSAAKPKLLNAMPTAYFEAHKQLKKDGGTSLDFSQYIYEATREKLERDGKLK